MTSSTMNNPPSPADSVTLANGVVTHEEARESARRLINSHFRQEPSARIGIPARPGYDDDLIITRYIEQQQALATQPPPSAATMSVETAAALYDAIKHGDDRHREWLRAALMAFAAGEPLPQPDKRDPTAPSAAVAALVKQWKAAALPNLRSSANFNVGYGRALIECADALTAALAKQEPGHG